MNKILLAAALLSLAGCGILDPANVQQSFRMTQPDGTVMYHFDGYTNRWDNKPGAGRKYLEAAIKPFCPNGYTVVREDEQQTRGGSLLKWDGDAKCNAVKKPVDEVAPEK